MKLGARVAKSADAKDLKSFFRQRECGFKSRPGHQNAAALFLFGAACFLRKWLEESRRRGLDLVLEIDVQGAEQVKRKLPESAAIFILPPSREELEKRLRGRGQDADEEIARRLAKAREEIAASEKFYDFCVVNDDVERAGKEAQAIVTALRCSSARRRDRLNQVLASFGG